MRMIRLLTLALLLSAVAQAEAAGLRLRALLVVASNQGGETDSSLAAYEPTLRRILRFDTYRLAGDDTSAVQVPGRAALSPGRGHNLTVEADASGGRLRVQWEQNGKALMNTGLALRRGAPAVLGGPSTGQKGEVWAVILVAD